MRAALALALLALLLAPAAGAAPSIGVAPFPFPVAPLRDDARTLVTVESDCGADVTLAVEDAPAWAEASFEPPVLPSPACQGTWSDGASLGVRLAEDAPAGEVARLTVVARAGNASARAELPVVVAFRNTLEVVANETTKVAKPQAVAIFAVTLTNRGNGAARIEMPIAQAPRALKVVEPVSIVLQPGQTATVPLMAQTPYHNGQLDEVDTFAVAFRSSYALDPSWTGDAETLTFTVHTKGLYVPGVAPPLALLGLALVAMMQRTRGRMR